MPHPLSVLHAILTPRRRAAARFLTALACLAGLTGAPAAAAGPPLVLGILHPFPGLCLGQERSQKDVRVLRLAFGLEQAPRARLQLPWFYTLRPAGRPPGAGPAGGGPAGDDDGAVLRVNARALWPAPAGTAHPAVPALPGALAPWHAQVAARLPALAGVSPDPGRFAYPARKPFLPARLGGTGLLPFFVGSDGLPPSCRPWPGGVVMTPLKGKFRYRLIRGAGPRGPAFTLTAHRTAKALLREFARGRTDGLLLEGPELAEGLGRTRPPPGWVLGREPGTQQIVLRTSPWLREVLEPQGLQFLSMAIARERLARGAGPGFLPARAFFGPVGEPREPPPVPLRWDSLHARRGWLARPRPKRKLRLAVLDHPALVRTANALAAQWQKTLNLAVDVAAFSELRFRLPGRLRGFDMVLEVVDLDDGSLQDLWEEALAGAPGPGSAGKGSHPVSAWEARLLRELPYLPVLQNAHFLLSPSRAAWRRAAAACPACRELPLATLLKARRR